MSLVPSKCWNGKNWVNFNIVLGDYENIITFLDANKISFLYTMELDFTVIPIVLHGRGRSRNLLQYLANNTDNNTLITSFLRYFLGEIADIRYATNKKINYDFLPGSKWQNTTFVPNGYTPPEPVLTTTTLLPTTTLLMMSMETFELFGQLFTL